MGGLNEYLTSGLPLKLSIFTPTVTVPNNASRYRFIHCQISLSLYDDSRATAV